MPLARIGTVVVEVGADPALAAAPRLLSAGTGYGVHGRGRSGGSLERALARAVVVAAGAAGTGAAIAAGRGASVGVTVAGVAGEVVAGVGGTGTDASDVFGPAGAVGAEDSVSGSGEAGASSRPGDGPVGPAGSASLPDSGSSVDSGAAGATAAGASSRTITLSREIGSLVAGRPTEEFGEAPTPGGSG